MHLGAPSLGLLDRASLSFLLHILPFPISPSKNQLSGQGLQIKYVIYYLLAMSIYLVKLISGIVNFFSIPSKYGVHGFPTLFLLNSTMRVRYHGNRSFESLGAFYSDVTGKAFDSQLFSFCGYGDLYYVDLIYLVVCFD